MPSSRKLKPEMQRLVTRLLARRWSPQEVATLLAEDYEVVINRQAVEYYDPTKDAGKELTAELRALFLAEREQYNAGAYDVPIGQTNWRLERYQRGVVQLMRSGNYLGAAELLEKAAKDKGGAFTNRREVSGKDGGPIRITKAEDLSDDQLASIATGENK